MSRGLVSQVGYGNAPQYLLDHLGKTQSGIDRLARALVSAVVVRGILNPGSSEATNVESDEDCPSLDHRPVGSDMPVTETRTVPSSPELVTLLRAHLNRYGTTPDGRIFQTVRSGTLKD
jgi:hypothetical protein